MSRTISTASLPSICSLVTDGTHDSPKLQPSGVPFIKGKHISSGHIDFESCDYISEEDHLKCVKRVKPQIDDVLFANIGSVGDVARVSDDRDFSIKNLALFRPDPSKVDPTYFYYLVVSNSFRGVFLNVRSGAAQQFISLEAFRSHRFPFNSDKAQQRKIGITLSSYDDLTENNQRRMGLLEEAARQLYREWFVRLRFPGHEHTPITDGVPEGWGRAPVPDAIAINPRTPLSDDDEHWWVEMADLSTNSMVIQNAIKRSGRSGSKFRNGDTLFARITPCLENGKTAFANFMAENEVGRGSTEFIVLRSISLTPEFVYCLARTYDFREHAIKSMIGASGRQRVQESCFDKFLILVPSRSLLALFGESAGALFQQIKILHAQNHKLRTARDLLLPRLVSGEVAV